MPAAAELVRFATSPPYGVATPDSARAAVDAACAAALACAQKLSSDKADPTWDNLVLPLEASAERIDREYSLVAHLHGVAATPQWDQANQQCVAKVVGAQTQINQDAGLYRRLLQLRATCRDQLDPGRRRILDEAIIGYEHSGVGLPDKKRREFAANERRLSQLGANFEENVRTATAAWSKIVPETAFGAMPADLRAAARCDEGYKVELLDPSYLAYMAHGTDRSLRELLAKARNARASDLGPTQLDNTPLVREIMQLRQKQAKLLGFNDPATLILSRRMAKEPEQVEQFLAKLAQAAASHAKRELARLTEFAQAECGIDRIEAWDLAFVGERLRQHETGLADAQVRAYFGVDRVLDGLFDCAGSLFGISFERVASTSNWDPQVVRLRIKNAAGAPVGELLLDLYARPNKRGGAWVHGALHRCTLPAGSQLPLALINCNFTAGVDKPARLSWEEVVTLFHEAGHALHHLLTKVDDYSASGMNGVEWDAVELPSQFLENFAWRREIALAMSAHEQSGEPMDETMFAKLQARRNFLPGLFVTRQLALASFDLQIHRNRDADPIELWNRIRATYMVTPALENERLPCSFGHIFAGGYATGYYGYLWADVLAADAYEMFADAANQHALGTRFASEVLERGGTRSAEENFFALRGRSPSPAALLRRLGLS